ncbi:MAG: aminoglycoside phosphotransferase family protein [Ktedonobacteraceae bacterium]|nr:aminoglycoside phosphotransferase family protein [Ktedonobacteraceae bacterium]
MQRVKTIVSRVFPSSPLSIERVAEGGSTHVYRIVFEGETFYLRVLPEEGASFAPEVTVHERLRQMHIKVPEVIYFEAYNELFQRSIMMTTEIRGEPISQSHSLSEGMIAGILHEAGRELATINSVTIEGFGWIRRDLLKTDELYAQWPTYRAFVLEFWESDLAYLSRNAISRLEATQLDRVLSQHDSWLDVEQASLAHGDFGATHIYQENGCYTGIIDFGEIRGTDRWYDLSHFHLQAGEQLSPRLEAALIDGYKEIVSLGAEAERHISFTSLLTIVRALARSLQRRPPNWYTQYLLEMLRKELRNCQMT